MTGPSHSDDDYQKAATFLRDFHRDRHARLKCFELNVIHEALDDAAPPPKSSRKLQKKQASMCLVSLGAEDTQQDPPELCDAPQANDESWGHFIDDERASGRGNGRKRMIPRHPRTTAVWKPKRGRSNT